MGSEGGPRRAASQGALRAGQRRDLGSIADFVWSDRDAHRPSDTRAPVDHGDCRAMASDRHGLPGARAKSPSRAGGAAGERCVSGAAALLRARDFGRQVSLACELVRFLALSVAAWARTLGRLQVDQLRASAVLVHALGAAAAALGLRCACGGVAAIAASLRADARCDHAVRARRIADRRVSPHLSEVPFGRGCARTALDLGSALRLAVLVAGAVFPRVYAVWLGADDGVLGALRDDRAVRDDAQQ